GKAATKKGWGTPPPGQVGTPPVAKGGPDDGAAAGGPEGKGRWEGQRNGDAMSRMDPAMLERFRGADPAERRKMLEDRGVPPDRIDMILRRVDGGGFGGPPGGGGPGR
ncbi:MAG: HlyD family secretion protein, partial [Planctomycetaceae bacterium]